MPSPSAQQRDERSGRRPLASRVCCMLQMATGIDLHHKILRAALKECQGYEVATEGDSFKCAFGTPGGCIPTRHVLPAITAQVANRAARVSLAARELNNQCRCAWCGAEDAICWSVLVQVGGRIVGWRRADCPCLPRLPLTARAYLADGSHGGAMGCRAGGRRGDLVFPAKQMGGQLKGSVRHRLPAVGQGIDRG